VGVCQIGNPIVWWLCCHNYVIRNNKDVVVGGMHEDRDMAWRTCLPAGLPRVPSHATVWQLATSQSTYAIQCSHCSMPPPPPTLLLLRNVVPGYSFFFYFIANFRVLLHYISKKTLN